MKHLLLILALLTSVALIASEKSESIKIMEKNKCFKCHSISSLDIKAEKKKSVDLSEVGDKKYTNKWISKFIAREVTKENGKKHGKKVKMTEEDEKMVIEFLQTLTKKK